MKKLTRKQFIDKAAEGPIKINPTLNYVVIKVNSKNIEMSDMLKEQLTNEGLYDRSFVGIMANSDVKAPFPMESLPIYGRSDKYETKHFKMNLEDAVMTDLRDRGLQLLNRELEARKTEK